MKLDRQEWEYRVYESTNSPETLQRDLTRLGKEGWELLPIVQLTASFLLIFKRPISSADDFFNSILNSKNT
jgi:hypothetical protein